MAEDIWTRNGYPESKDERPMRKAFHFVPMSKRLLLQSVFAISSAPLRYILKKGPANSGSLKWRRQSLATPAPSSSRASCVLRASSSHTLFECALVATHFHRWPGQKHPRVRMPKSHIRSAEAQLRRDQKRLCADNTRLDRYWSCAVDATWWMQPRLNYDYNNTYNYGLLGTDE
jgi:hypothetical protein